MSKLRRLLLGLHAGGMQDWPRWLVVLRARESQGEAQSTTCTNYTLTAEMCYLRIHMRDCLQTAHLVLDNLETPNNPLCIKLAALDSFRIVSTRGERRRG